MDVLMPIIGDLLPESCSDGLCGDGSLTRRALEDIADVQNINSRMPAPIRNISDLPSIRRPSRSIVIRRITRDLPDTRVLVLSSYSDEEYVQQLTEQGASGYLVKQTAATDLIKAIREAHKGNAFFSPSISKRFLEQCRDAFSHGSRVAKKTGRLTSREAEVLQMIAEGLANKQIAAQLGISIKTVEKHRQQVMNKLGIHDVAGLTRHAISKGIVEAKRT